MPAILAVISAAFLAGCIGSQGGMVGQPHIGWINSYEEGLEKAKIENKPVFLYFWAVWCSFCAKMDKEVLSDGEVAALIKNSFVPVLLDVDDEANFKYMGDYRVMGTPAFVILSPQGELIRGTMGYKTKEDFMDFLRG